MKRVIVLGSDGFIGWSLTKYLCERGDSVLGIDNTIRRSLVLKTKGDSILPITNVYKREKLLRDQGNDFTFQYGNLTKSCVIRNAIKTFEPEVIVHLGEIPSAPYSMMGVEEAGFVQTNNILSTLNLLFAVKEINSDIKIIKLGTMGQYQIGNIPISEGWIDIEYKGRKETVPFPKVPGSMYHISKNQDTLNIEFACRVWGLNCTDINQGVVFGVHIDCELTQPEFFTRLDADSIWGTAINRFCSQAVIEHPITVYGSGGQKRGFLPLRDSVRCITLLIDNPTNGYRIVNQLADIYQVSQLAIVVKKIAGEFGLDVKINNYENPRFESEDHFYEVERNVLNNLGYKSSIGLEDEIRNVICALLPYKERIKLLEHVLVPDIFWSGENKKSNILGENS